MTDREPACLIICWSFMDTVIQCCCVFMRVLLAESSEARSLKAAWLLPLLATTHTHTPARVGERLDIPPGGAAVRYHHPQMQRERINAIPLAAAAMILTAVVAI